MESKVGGQGKGIEWVIGTLRESERRTKRYFVGSIMFYALVIAFLVFLTLTAREASLRNAFIAFIVLSYLGFNGLWISSLRGLRGRKFSLGDFLRLFRLPLTAELRKLEDEDGWDSEEEREHFALEQLELQAKAENEHLAWPNRILSLSVITAIDLLVWLVWHNPVMALANQVVAMAISQIHINLGPKVSMKAVAELKQSERRSAG